MEAIKENTQQPCTYPPARYWTYTHSAVAWSRRNAVVSRVGDFFFFFFESAPSGDGRLGGWLSCGFLAVCVACCTTELSFDPGGCMFDACRCVVRVLGVRLCEGDY